MKTNNILTALLTLSFVGSVTAASEASWVKTLTSSKTSLVSNNINSPQINTNREAVSFSYKLDANKVLEFNAKPFEEQSRQYWMDSTGAYLKKGIDLPVTGGETIVRISPLSNNKVALTSRNIRIQNNGQDKSIEVFADSENLKSTGVPFSENSIAFKVNAQAGILKLNLDSYTDTMPFVIHVLEKDSPYVLILASNKANYGSNEVIAVNTSLLSGNMKVGADLQGYISRPDGSILGKLNFNAESDGNYFADIKADGAQGLAEGLWEVHVFAKGIENGVEIMRDAQTSFAVNLKTAEFTNNLNMKSGLLEVGVNIGLEGRYEVRGVLMGTSKTGKMQPIAITMTADWLKVGQQSMSLNLEQKLIKESGLSAPFALKNVQLTNQTYLAPVQTIQSGISIIGLELDVDLR